MSHQYAAAIDDNDLAGAVRLAHQVEVSFSDFLRFAGVSDKELSFHLAIERFAVGLRDGRPERGLHHATGRPFDWEFRRGEEVVAIKAHGRLVVNDLATKLALCAGGNGIAQTIELGLAPMFASGALVQVLPDWAEERFPLYAYYPSRHLPPAKVRAFVDFVAGIVAS